MGTRRVTAINMYTPSKLRYGFTLMELLVATTLLSIVLSSVYILFIPQFYMETIRSGVIPQQDARLVMSLIAAI
jgi:prepilin-type N-terminal cleavage/methylation domain-containing protein